MQEDSLLVRQINRAPDEINLTDLWRTIWADKLIIIITCSIFALASIAFALSKPNIYRASILLAPAATDSNAGGLAGLASQFGGIASMAGISLGSSGGDKTVLALEIIKSRSFIERFLIKHQLLVPLMATKSWDIESNKLVFDQDLYDAANDVWLRKVSLPKQAKPSLWETYQEFLELLTISQDKTTSMVVITLDFYSPQLAQQWLAWLVDDLNEFMRREDQQETQASIDYLTEQLKSIQVANMENIFYQLIEEQTKNMMLTHVKKDFIFQTLDPSQVPETKDSPKRALIVILGTILGGIFSVLIIFVRYLTQSNKKTVQQ